MIRKQITYLSLSRNFHQQEVVLLAYLKKKLQYGPVDYMIKNIQPNQVLQ